MSMTDSAATAPRQLDGHDFVLATDLDGTFLGGTEADRARLYDWIEGNRHSIGLIFVTGRDPDFIVELCDGGVPWPDYVIGDVGTTIAATTPAREIHPIADLEQEIAHAWNDRGAAVRAALAGHPGLTLQPTAFRYRVSFDLDPGTYCASAEDKVAALGLDHLMSDNRFFDVLPRGVSKGPSLRRLAAHLGIAPRRLLAAGDTLNDLSMLASGLPAVAVGGAEPALTDRLRGIETVYHAQGIGAAGILEAVAALNLHATPKGS